MEKSIIKNRIKKIIKDKPVRMHMPGHKGKKRNLKLDITEIEGSDNLHNPTGIINKVQEKIASIYGSNHSFLLVDGSTVGVQASILSSLDEGDQILIPVNAHRSVYPALSFSRAKPVYYKPIEKQFGMIVTKDLVQELINENPDVKALLITSPDYYGNISEIQEISDLLKEKKITLIVDEAHGAHLHFIPEYNDAITSGADFVIQSTHKILGSPTQSALLHINKNVNKRKVQRVLSLLESSSPSFILMSGIEEAVDEAESKAERIFNNIYHAHSALEKSQNKEDLFKLITPDGNYDKSKFLFIFPDNYPLEKELIEKYKIIPEFISGNLVLFMTGIGTSQRDLNRLLGTVKMINKELKEQGFKPSNSEYSVESYITPFQTKGELYEIIGKTGKLIPIEKALNKISADFIIPYPPGTPYLIPGSIISQENIDILIKMVKDNINIIGLELDDKQILIEVLEKD